MSKKHMLLMVACCLIPLSAFVLISIFSIPTNSVLTLSIILLCPLLHFVMMRGMMHNHHTERPPIAQKVQQASDEN